LVKFEVIDLEQTRNKRSLSFVKWVILLQIHLVFLLRIGEEVGMDMGVTRGKFSVFELVLVDELIRSVLEVRWRHSSKIVLSLLRVKAKTTSYFRIQVQSSKIVY
jgi:hypothetical protein